MFRLKIMSKVDEVVYKGSNINTSDYIEVVMLENGNPIAPDHHLASAKVELVLLKESFKKTDEDCWTVDDFNAHLHRRKRKSEKGNVNQETEITIRNCTFDLTGGSCCHHGVRIMENSNRELVRLGVKVVGPTKERVLEGVLSEPFKVQELKTKEYAKRAIPSLDDDIWRLNGIAQNSKACTAIQKEGMNTVGDLLSLYCEDDAKLKQILKCAYPHDTKVEAIIKHAKKCGDGLCFYEDGDVVLFFNYEDQLVGAQFSGIYRKLAELEGREKDRAITLSETAKDNKKSWRGGYKMEDDRPKKWQPRSLGPNSAQLTSVQILKNGEVQGLTGDGEQQTFRYGPDNCMGLPSENFDTLMYLPQAPNKMMEEEMQGGAGCYLQEGFGHQHEPPVQGVLSFVQHHNQSGSVQHQRQKGCVQLPSFHTVPQHEMQERQAFCPSDAPVYPNPALHGVPPGVGGQNQDSESSVHGEFSTSLGSSLRSRVLDLNDPSGCYIQELMTLENSQN